MMFMNQHKPKGNMTMNNNTRWIIAIIGTTALLTTLTGCNRGNWGFHSHNDPAKKVEWVKEEIDDHLDLNDNQKQELDTLANQLLTLHMERKESRKTRHEEIRNLIAAPSLDQSRIQQLVQEHTDYINTNSGEVIAAIASFTDTLSQQQREAVLEKIDRWRSRFED